MFKNGERVYVAPMHAEGVVERVDETTGSILVQTDAGETYARPHDLSPLPATPAAD